MTPIVNNYDTGKAPILPVPECEPGHKIKDSVAEVDEILKVFTDGLKKAFPWEHDIKKQAPTPKGSLGTHGNTGSKSKPPPYRDP